MEKKTSNDEIDLLYLFLKGINVIRANIWLITSFFFLGAIIGLTGYFTARKVYENRMLISSAILTESYGKILIDNINKLLREGNIQAVSQDLKLPKETVKDITKIKTEDIPSVDESKENERFIILVETYNENILPDLQKGLVYYLENNEYVKTRVNQNKEYMKQVLAKMEQEIKDMEDFKERLFKGDFFQSSRGNVMFDPTVVNSKILELTKEKMKLQNEFSLANSVHVIEGFTPFQQPSKPQLGVSILAGASLGLFFVGAILAIKSIRKVMRMADNSKQHS